MGRNEQRWRDVMARTDRSERQRVLPLPLAFAAVLLPFLAAWATAGELEGRRDGATPAAWEAPGRELPRALVQLGRGDRLPDQPGGYVDVWGPLEDWEADFLKR